LASTRQEPHLHAVLRAVKERILCIPLDGSSAFAFRGWFLHLVGEHITETNYSSQWNLPPFTSSGSLFKVHETSLIYTVAWKIQKSALLFVK